VVALHKPNRDGSRDHAQGGLDRPLFVPSDVRVRLGRWGVGDAVLIERLTTRQRWTANSAVAATLVTFTGGRTVREGAEAVAKALGVGQDEVLRQIDVLRRIGLLATVENGADDMADRWCRHGWVAAYDYHLATWGFPLVDYTAEGWETDRVRMASYRGMEPDPGPLAHDYCAALPTSWDLAEELRADSPAPLTTVLHNTEATACSAVHGSSPANCPCKGGVDASLTRTGTKATAAP
jgi:hypothetical protein